MGRESLSPDYPISKRLDGDLETPLGLNRASEEEQMGNAKTTLSAWQKTIIALTVAMGLATVSQAKEGFDRDFEIKTLSSRPDTVSGGDAVVQVTLPRYASARDVVLELNGVDVTSAFVADATGRQLTGLITGMALGKNELTARAKYHHGGQHFEKLQLVNYPSYGPVFSGEHQRPWICETAASGVGAPPAEGPCVAPSRTDSFGTAFIKASTSSPNPVGKDRNAPSAFSGLRSRRKARITLPVFASASTSLGNSARIERRSTSPA